MGVQTKTSKKELKLVDDIKIQMRYFSSLAYHLTYHHHFCQLLTSVIDIPSDRDKLKLPEAANAAVNEVADECLRLVSINLQQKLRWPTP